MTLDRLRWLRHKAHVFGGRYLIAWRRRGLIICAEGTAKQYFRPGMSRRERNLMKARLVEQGLAEWVYW